MENLYLIGVAALLALPLSGLAGEVADVSADTSEEPQIEQLSAKSVDQIAAELSSPVNSLFFMDNDLEYRSYQGTLPGSDDQSSLAFDFAVSYPFMLKNGRSITVRAAIPFFLDQAIWVIDRDSPVWEPDTDYRDFRIRQSPYVTPDTGGYIPGYAHDHVGDVTLAAAYSGISDGGFISSYGLVTVLPTSQDYL